MIESKELLIGEPLVNIVGALSLHSMAFIVMSELQSAHLNLMEIAL